MLLVAILVSSCSSWQQQKLTAPQWKITGKIIVKEAGEKAKSAQFNWQQQDSAYLIHVLSPLGQVLLKISGNDQQAKLVDNEGQTYTAASAEQLLNQFGQWQLPIDHLQYWIQGQLLGDEKNMSYDENNVLQSAKKTPWQVNWQYPEDSTEPKRVTLNNISTQQKIIVIIKSYEQL